MVSIQFFGDVGEIGGNKILLEDGETRIWLDFGQSFTMGKDYFIDWLQPRGINGLRDYFEFNLLPKIPGLYSEENLSNTDLPYQDPNFNVVLLTHAHYDHCQHIQFLDPRIPIYTGEGTKIFMEAMEESGSQGGLGEHIYKTFRTGNVLKVGDLEVEPIHVDHSIPGAYGYLIHTSMGTIAYSGDVKFLGGEFIQIVGGEYLEARVSLLDDTSIEGTIPDSVNEVILSHYGVASAYCG